MAKPTILPEQTQSRPGKESKMAPEPEIVYPGYKGSAKLKGSVALVTGGDSGIGRSICVYFAKEGAHVSIVYLSEDKDAKDTKKMVEAEGVKCLLIKGDLKSERFCKSAVARTVEKLGKLNILVNNAAQQFPESEIKDISKKQLSGTFETNIFPMFYLVREAVEHMGKGDTIINTTSVTAYRGSEHLLDYSSTKGAIVTFTRSLSTMLVSKGIRVNGVAPGPIWTPLIVSTFDDVSDFGSDTPMKRAGQPSEVGPSYVFLASKDASYITGQIIHVNGGEMVAS
ncbi:SDR family oxidoreductase [Flavobacterium selenitireducens]|uniref:SDR family oxidoreductase n=1 Tax=Flavobacterium selenitireducens TaxID=2722704 RepID=UPI00168BE127|nr:SDR family oxidoreductase [Flavobacterium selenitireducens]MBD3581408.1 SDR family oxidoreductase [Flavobacterium selenitireducens]